MKSGFSLAILLATALPVSAQMLAFSGENSLSIEGGVSGALNYSTGSILVENNIGAGAPWAVTELVAAKVLGFGAGGSFGAEANFELASGKAIYLRTSGNFATGSTDLGPLFGVSAAIPGLHDDGFLLQSAWGPVATVSTRMLDAGIGLKTAPTNGISYFAGVLYGGVAQDLELVYDFDPATPENTTVSGRSSNAMVGAEIGASITRDVSDKLKLVVFGEIAALSNSFDYSYDYLNGEPGGATVALRQAGTSLVVRSEVSVQLAYAQSERVSFTGKVGYVNYGNLSTGLENTINPNNTAASITPVFGSVGMPYIRAGVAISF